MDRIQLSFQWPRSTFWNAFIFLVACALIGGWHWKTINFALSLIAAILGLYIMGTAIANLLPRMFPKFLLQQGLAFRLLMGQWSLVTLIKLFSPLILMIRPWFEFEFFAFISCWMLVGGILLIARLKSNKQSLVALADIQEARGFIFFGIIIFGVGLIYGQDLAPLGLDTHTHITYTQQILEAGYLPLEARTTPIIDNYVKSAHALAAIWAGLGLYAFSGPYFKIMPLIQFSLIVIFLAETLFGVIREKAQASAGWNFLLGGLALPLIFLFGIVATQAAYPILDLNGTPRIIALSLVMFPLILVWVGLLNDNPNLILTSLFLTPWLAGLAFTCNPVVVVALFTFVWPAVLLGLMFQYFTGQRGKLHPIDVWDCIIPCVLGLIVGLYDPFVINKILSVFPEAGAFIQAQFGLMSHSMAVAQGLINKDAIVDISNTTNYACQGLNCLMDAIVSTLPEIPSFTWDSLEKNFPPIVDTMSARQQIRWNPIVITVSSLVFARLILEKRFQGRFNKVTLTFLMVIINVYVGILLQKTIGRVLIATIGSLSLEGRLFGHYTWHYPAMLMGSFVTIILLWGILVWGIPLTRGPIRLFSAGASSKLILALGWALYLGTIFRISNYRIPLPDNAWAIGPVLEKDVREFWNAEAKVPTNERIVVPAFYMFIDRQHWILPINSVSGFLPYSRRKLVFNVYIGDSLFWNWHHLDELCTSEARAKRFLETQRISWFMIPAPTEVALEQSFYCKTEGGRSYIKAAVKGKSILALPFARGRAQFISVTGTAGNMKESTSHQ
jgi:hypothetical protein